MAQQQNGMANEQTSHTGTAPALMLLAVLAAASSGCASHGGKIASTQSALDSARQSVAHNSAGIAQQRALVVQQRQRQSYLNSAAGRRDFYDGRCHRVPVQKPQLEPRPAQSCKTDTQTRVHAVNQCINPGNCEYVGALYALGRLPLEYQYVLNSGCPYTPEDKTFMQEYVGMAATPLCNLTLNSKRDRNKRQGKRNSKRNGKFNWSGVVLDLAQTLACNVKKDPYREEYGQITQCLARASSQCEQRYTQWENRRNQSRHSYLTQVRKADQDFATCQTEIKKLGYSGGDIRLQIEQRINAHNAAIEELQRANTDAQARIRQLQSTLAAAKAQQASSKKPRRTRVLFH